MRLPLHLILSISILSLATACDSEESSPDGGAGGDGGVSRDGAIPKQTCSKGWATTHLIGPGSPGAYKLTGLPAPSLLLASGLRQVTAGKIGDDIILCVARTGCIVLAQLPDSGGDLRKRLEQRGIHVIEHFSDRYYILALEKGADVAAAKRDGDLGAADLLRAGDKLPPDVPDQYRKKTGRVVLMADARGRRWRRTFADLKLPLTRAGERSAASRKWVYRVAAERMSANLTTMETRKATGVEDLQGFSLKGDIPSYSGYSGEGITVMVMDRGVDKKHLDLHAFDSSGKDLGTRVVGAPPNTTTWGPHGTGVSSLLAGNGYNSKGKKYYGQEISPCSWRGMAPQVSKIVSVYLDMAEAAKAVADHGPHLSNHSHQLAYLGYPDQAKQIDGWLHSGTTYNGVTYPPRPVIWSAGNQDLVSTAPVHGYHALTCHAKNPITVGGSNANDGSFAHWASHGPTYDGRIKPDIVAPAGKNFDPPDGIKTEIDEIRLKAKAGSGAADIVWKFDKDGDAEGWKPRSDATSAKVAGGSIQAALAGHGSGLLGLFQEGLSIDGDKYDQLQVRARLQVKTVPGKYRWPWGWFVGWNKLYGVNSTIAPAERNTAWRTHTVKLPANTFKGTITYLRIGPVSSSGILAAMSGTQGYKMGAGTSYSAPVVSGIVALLLEQFKKEKGADLKKAPPLPSTLKALLIHTAKDMIKTTAELRDPNNPDTKSPTLFHKGPDFATGYGLVDAKAASELLSASAPATARKLVEDKISAGQLHTYHVAVSSSVSVKALKATLAWDDAPGNPVLAFDASQLVNDLDMVAISPSGKAHGPWVLDPLPLDKTTYQKGYDPIKQSDVKAARRCVEAAPWKKKECEDHRNNVEQVLVENPEAGWWTIKIRGHKVPKGPQRYSLIVAGSCS